MSNVDSSTPAVANAPAAINGNTQSVALFQKAHAKMITLQRVDEQLLTLQDQRKKLQEELRGIQAQINEEFDRLLKATGVPAGDENLPTLPAAPFSADTKSSKRNRDALRMEVAQAV